LERRRNASRFFSADRIAALIFLVLVAVYGWEGSRFSAALQVDVVGPALFPKMLTVAGFMLGVALLIGRGEEKSGAGESWKSHFQALAPVLLLLGYVLALVPVGFPLATTVFLTVTFRYLGHPTWRGPLLLATVITAAAFVLFHVMLEVRLPLGFPARLF
jgi:putative tricarboxylic transport membrane protein